MEILKNFGPNGSMYSPNLTCFFPPACNFVVLTFQDR